MLIRNIGAIVVTASLLWSAGCEKPGAAERSKESAAAGANLEAQNRAAQVRGAVEGVS